MKTTLKTRLLASSMLMVLLTVVALVVMSSYFIRSNAMSSTEREVQSLIDTFATGMGNWVNDRQNTVKSLGNTIENHPGQDVTPFLMEAYQALGFGLSYYGDEQGNMFRQDPSLYVAGYDPRVRDWYKGAKASGKLFVSAPYISATTKTQVITIAQPVQKDGQLIGVAASNVEIGVLTDSVRRLSLPGDGYGILLQRNGVIVSHPKAELNNKPITDFGSQFTDSWLRQRASSNKLDQFDFNGSTKLFYVADIPNTDWSLIFVIDKASIMAEATKLAWLMIAMGAGFLVLFALILMAVFKMQFKDLERVSAALNEISQGAGDLTVSIKTQNAHDEIGVLAHGFNLFVAHLHGMISRMGDIATQLGAQSTDARGSAEQNQQHITIQQDEITMVATAVTEMASATEEIASNAELTAQTSQDAVKLAESGQQQVMKSQTSIRNLADEVSNAGHIISELNQHSQKINGILLTISGISEQTNLLALNAAIEAARAGEQGRGFAVVADEVRVLSQRTHASTQEIQAMIETLQRTASKAVASMENSHRMAEMSVGDVETASNSLQQINSAINQISDMASQIATAAEEQTSVTSEINRNTEAIREVSLGLSDGAIESTHKAHQLSELAHALQSEVGRFKL
ncbi:methyl-accepting chemotaxis protein [Shewanella sp. C32]|uniref:Methyl-accepting chemotaxis protein n=1 Tax=Shewanella electrica TaxID=515560 RepID=A0ABT2FM44_9GAMM|nr:methyl-accepting chemotaxis protein [Shewanella electrica]MCH1925986.1 methyl-accepting chemotaxis protein [Shewanella electrica]MCS4557407.1 methyl-accepting chemotaxis protein [Shewanella electrica]